MNTCESEELKPGVTVQTDGHCQHLGDVTEKSGVQGQPQLRSKFEVRLDYIRPISKK